MNKHTNTQRQGKARQEAKRHYKAVVRQIASDILSTTGLTRYGMYVRKKKKQG